LRRRTTEGQPIRIPYHRGEASVVISFRAREPPDEPGQHGYSRRW